jgi:hypothetical protein
LIEKAMSSQQTGYWELVRKVTDNLEIIGSDVKTNFMGVQVHRSSTHDPACPGTSSTAKISDSDSTPDIPMEEAIRCA